MNGKTVAVLATLDTKGPEAAYLREQIIAAGHLPLLVDVGVVGEPATSADITRQEVARAGGSSLEHLLANPTRDEAAPIMAAGATEILNRLVQEGEVAAIIALGGTQGTTLCTTVMRALPYGFPKVMVSTMASGNVAPWVDTKDITMMFSVTDIMGMNPFMKKILANAAAAACGMADCQVGFEVGDRPLVAITTVGITTQGAMQARSVLEAAGFDVIVFHAVGTGGRAMEEMMRQGIIGAVLDFSIIEVSNEMFEALLAGGPERLTIAGELGLPQVICPGAVEVLVFNEPHTVPKPFQDRTLVRHSPKITDVRLNTAEMVRVGKEVSARLQHTSSPALFLAPTEGFDSYATAQGPFHDPAADRAFLNEVRSGLPRSIRYAEVSTHINDPDFATGAAEALVALVREHAV